MTHKSSDGDIKFEAVCECVLDDRTTKNDVAVYATLLANASGATSRPSRKRIAHDASINYVNVSRHTRKLESLGYIVTKHTRGRITNVYGLPKLSDMGVIPATVEYSPLTPLVGPDMGITGDTPHNLDMGITGDTPSLRASSSKNLFCSPEKQADAPHKRAQDAGPTKQESRKPEQKPPELFPVERLQELWNQVDLDNWAPWRHTTPKLMAKLPEALEVVRSYKPEMDDAAVAGFLEFVASIDFFAGRRLKHDGTVFYVTPDYIFGDPDRLNRILQGEYSSYGDPIQAEQRNRLRPL